LRGHGARPLGGATERAAVNKVASSGKAVPEGDRPRVIVTYEEPAIVERQRRKVQRLFDISKANAR
jgi:hypothetical protein